MCIFKPVNFGFIRSEYGNRIVNKVSQFHCGLDIAVVGNPENIPVYSATSGTVSYICYEVDKGGGFGKVIYIKGADGWYRVYAHLSLISYDLRMNQKVMAGDFIGIMGTTGLSSGIHLHYEERKQMTAGNSRNPTYVRNLYQ